MKTTKKTKTIGAGLGGRPAGDRDTPNILGSIIHETK
jgi:hypothetical protein